MMDRLSQSTPPIKYNQNLDSTSNGKALPCTKKSSWGLWGLTKKCLLAMVVNSNINPTIARSRAIPIKERAVAADKTTTSVVHKDSGIANQGVNPRFANKQLHDYNNQFPGRNLEDISDLTNVGAKQITEEQQLDNLHSNSVNEIDSEIYSEALKHNDIVDTESSKQITISKFLNIIDKHSKKVHMTETSILNVDLECKDSKLAVIHSFKDKKTGKTVASSKIDIAIHPLIAEFLNDQEQRSSIYELDPKKPHRLNNIDIDIISDVNDSLYNKALSLTSDSPERLHRVQNILKKIFDKQTDITNPESENAKLANILLIERPEDVQLNTMRKSCKKEIDNQIYKNAAKKGIAESDLTQLDMNSSAHISITEFADIIVKATQSIVTPENSKLNFHMKYINSTLYATHSFVDKLDSSITSYSELHINIHPDVGLYLDKIKQTAFEFSFFSKEKYDAHIGDFKLGLISKANQLLHNEVDFTKNKDGKGLKEEEILAKIASKRASKRTPKTTSKKVANPLLNGNKKSKAFSNFRLKQEL